MPSLISLGEVIRIKTVLRKMSESPTTFSSFKNALLDNKWIAVLAIIGTVVVALGSFSDAFSKLTRFGTKPKQELSPEANQRIERLEKLVEVLASRAAAADLDPIIAAEAREAESQIRGFIEKARNNPSIVESTAIDVALVVAHTESEPGGSQSMAIRDIQSSASTPSLRRRLNRS